MVKETTLFNVIIGAMLIVLLTVLWTYIAAHGNGYRDAFREVPLYYEVTGEFPGNDIFDKMQLYGHYTRADIIEMLYPHGQPEILPGE